MRKKALLLIGLSILIVFGIGIITSVLILNVPDEPDKPNEPKLYIASDDTYYSGRDSRETVNGNKTLLVAGRYVNASGSSIHYTFIKFDLKDKPKKWDNLEVSFYVYEYLRERDAVMYVQVLQYKYDWNETMPSYDIRWNVPQLSYDFQMKFILGLYKFNITNHWEEIENNESFTIIIFGYGGNSSTGYFDNHILIHSKEANVSKAWLPQLIWS